MTRFALLGGLMLALCAAATADDKKDVPKELAPFQGEWKVSSASKDGNAAPKLPDLIFKFDGEKVHVTQSKNEPDAGSYSVDATKKPAEIDMTNQKGEKVHGIYKFDGTDKLTLCFNRGKDATRPKSFDDAGSVILVLAKVKK